MKTRIVTGSLANIAQRCRSEDLGPHPRYVILSDLRMGDGSSRDELFPWRKALFRILTSWYLPRGYILVLNGDIENLRGFWHKDILKAWHRLYSVFDAFAEGAGLRKIVGEKDLGLLRIRKPPYQLDHGLRLTAGDSSILVFHGHQAAAGFACRDYLDDFMPRWTESSLHVKAGRLEENKGERIKAERRLYRASSALGIVSIVGHNKRPLFASLTRRDALRFDLDGTPGSTEGETALPFLHGAGAGAEWVPLIEIEGDSINQVLWSRRKGMLKHAKDGDSQHGSRLPYDRYVRSSASIEGVFSRLRRSGPHGEHGGDMSGLESGALALSGSEGLPQ